MGQFKYPPDPQELFNEGFDWLRSVRRPPDPGQFEVYLEGFFEHRKELEPHREKALGWLLAQPGEWEQAELESFLQGLAGMGGVNGG